MELIEIQEVLQVTRSAFGCFAVSVISSLWWSAANCHAHLKLDHHYHISVFMCYLCFQHASATNKLAIICIGNTSTEQSQ
jgi:hypothetical protein